MQLPLPPEDSADDPPEPEPPVLYANWGSLVTAARGQKGRLLAGIAEDFRGGAEQRADDWEPGRRATDRLTKQQEP